MKYKAKPIEMDAIQFDGDNFGEIQSFVGTRQIDDNYFIEAFDDVRNWWLDIPNGISAVVWVEPSKQWAGVKPGDYICQDIHGDFYPCEKDIFESKYEPITGVITTRDFTDRIQQSRRFNG